VLDTGIIPKQGDEVVLRIDTPAGQVTATATREAGLVTEVRFANVPSFAAELGVRVNAPGWGVVSCDLAFGGAFYAYVDAVETGVDMSEVESMIALARALKAAITSSRAIAHPEERDLGFLYGSIFTGPPVDPSNHSRHVCVFADGEVDRSPTGTGVSGRLAILHARGEVRPGQEISIESITGSVFRGRIVSETTVGGVAAVIPEVAGTAHILGRSELWVDPADDLGAGFLLR
jgi:trans-L-3-hydroxyproline dehydratase